MGVQNEILTAEGAYRVLNSVIASDVEEFWVMALGPGKDLLASKMLFRGTVDQCPAHPRDIFRFGCEQNASALLVAHNHPSGELVPSMEDLRVTRQLVGASMLIGIPIVDHLIVTTKGFTSMRRDGWFRFEDAV